MRADRPTFGIFLAAGSSDKSRFRLDLWVLYCGLLHSHRQGARVEQSLAAIANTHGLLAAASHDGPIWSSSGEQLNVNLIRLSRGAGIEAHINAELDVTIVVVQGEGLLTLDREERRVQAGDIVVIPRGMR